MGLSDVFVFIDEFKPDYVREFFKKYLEGFKSMDLYYESPKYSKETIFETDSFLDMFEFILEKEGRQFTFYLSSDKNDKYIQAILQINNDGSICLALSTFIEYENEFYNKLKSFYSNHHVFISYNAPLPSSKEEIDNLFLG